MYIDGVCRIGVVLQRQQLSTTVTIYKVVISIIVKNEKSKTRVQKFLATQPHPDKLDGIPIEIIVKSQK